ncbi:MAG TPA: PAS domain S-box protein, partial [Fusibacter sp.]|nr:PAS domain S-box protein [Fusibacter sp.]
MLGRIALDPSWHFICEDSSPMPYEDYPVNRVLATCEPLENYVVGIYQDRRTVVWVLVNAFPEFMIDGHINHIVVTFIDISDRKRAEIALEQELFRSQMLFNTSLDGVVVMNRLGNVVQASDSFAHMLGYSIKDVLNLNIADWDAQWIQDDLAEPFAKNQLPPLFETRYRRQDGSMYDVEVTWTQFELDHDVFNLCICRDISDRKQAELNLAISQKRHQNLVENSPDIIERFDLQLRHLYASPSLTELTGLSTEVFLGKTCRDLGMDETMITLWETAAAELLCSGQRQVIDFSVMTLKGLRTFEMVIAPELSEQKTIESILCISRDITERKEAEAALRQSEEKFRQITENIHQVFFIQALDGKILYVSPAYEQIWLQSSDRLYADQQTWLDIVHPHDRDRVEAALHQQMTCQGSFSETYRILRPDGEIRWISCQSFPLSDEFGKVTRFTGIAEDITQQKAVEDALRQSESTKQAIIEAIPDLLMRMSADGNKIEYISNSHFNLIDLDERWGNVTLADVLPPDLVQIRLRYVQAALASGTTKIYEQEILISNMVCYEEVRIVPLPNEEVLVMVRDITERRQIERERAQVEADLFVSEERLKLALEVSENGLWDWWITKESSYFSTRFYEMLGYNLEEVRMNLEFWIDMIHPDDRIWVMDRLNAHLRDQSVPYAFEYRLR